MSAGEPVLSDELSDGPLDVSLPSSVVLPGSVVSEADDADEDAPVDDDPSGSVADGDDADSVAAEEDEPSSPVGVSISLAPQPSTTANSGTHRLHVVIPIFLYDRLFNFHRARYPPDVPGETARGRGRPPDPKRRQELLDVSRDAFAERGYAGASLSLIAERAGVTKAALVNRFGSKETLYLSVMEQTVAELAALVLAAAQRPGSFAARVDELGRTVTGHLCTRRSAAQLLLSELIGRGPFGQSRSGAQQVATALGAIAAFLDAGMDSGEFTRQCPRQLTMSIVGLHLVHFAAHDVTTHFLGASPFDPKAQTTRQQAVTTQVQALLGLG